MYKDIKALDAEAMGRRVRKIRETKKMTREKLAEKVDVSVNFIADIEYGKKCPSVRKLYLLCQALETTADYLLGGNLYAADLGGEASETCREIMDILKACDAEYLKSIRDISVIYVDAMKK